MHDDGTATAGRKGIPYDWQALADDLKWEQIVAGLRADGCGTIATIVEIAQ